MNNDRGIRLTRRWDALSTRRPRSTHYVLPPPTEACSDALGSGRSHGLNWHRPLPMWRTFRHPTARLRSGRGGGEETPHRRLPAPSWTRSGPLSLPEALVANAAPIPSALPVSEHGHLRPRAPASRAGAQIPTKGRGGLGARTRNSASPVPVASLVVAKHLFAPPLLDRPADVLAGTPGHGKEKKRKGSSTPCPG